MTEYPTATCDKNILDSLKSTNMTQHDILANKLHLLEQSETLAGAFYSNNPPININPIEKITHSLWISSHKNAKEIPEHNFNNLVEQLSKISNNASEFKHILWCNDKKIIPDTIKKLESLDNINIEIREISELYQELKSLDNVLYTIEEELYGIAIDTLKYKIIETHGGILFDLNYKFHTNNLEQFLEKYNFFVDGAAMNEVDATIENYVLAANKNHPILIEISKISDSSLEHLRTCGYDKSLSQYTLTHDYSFSSWQAVVINGFNTGSTNSIDEIFLSPSFQDLSEVNITKITNPLGFDDIYNKTSWCSESSGLECEDISFDLTTTNSYADFLNN